MIWFSTYYIFAMKKPILILSLLPFLYVAPTTAQTLEQYRDAMVPKCEAELRPTVVKVEVQEAPIVEDRSLSIADITARRSKSKPALGNRSLGVTIHEVKTQWDAGSAMLGSDRVPIVCLRPQIKLTLINNAHTVYVAREYPYGSCAYNAVREHEERHVRANHLALWRMAQQFESELRTYYGNTIYYGNRNELNKWLSDSFVNNWQPRLRALRDDSHHIHDGIDTKEEYMRVNQMCNGEVYKIAQRAG